MKEVNLSYSALRTYIQGNTRWCPRCQGYDIKPADEQSGQWTTMVWVCNGCPTQWTETYCTVSVKVWDTSEDACTT